ncbi:unnamed protein product [Rotaria sp. Silwood1]|nr:unnamed protein product [Rotaria sp. Silwood1]
MKQNEFSPLPSLTSRITPWKLVSAQPSVTSNMNGSEDTTKMLFSINQNILDMKDNTHRMDEKLDRINDKIDQTALDTELHHETLIKLMPTLISIVGDFIWPVMNHNVAGLREKQSQLQKIFNDLEVLLSHLKSDYTARRKRSTSPPPRLAPSQQSSKASNNTPNNKSDQFLPKLASYGIHLEYRISIFSTNMEPIKVEVYV